MNYLVQSSLHAALDLPSSMTGWQAQIVEKDRGPFVSDVLLLQAGPLQMSYSFSSKSLITMGDTPVGAGHFVVQLSDMPSFFSYGNEVSSQEVAMSNSELNDVSPAGFRAVDICVRQDCLDELSERWECDSLLHSSRKGGVFRPDPAALSSLKGVLIRTFAHVRENPDPSLFHLAREEVMSSLGECFSSACPSTVLNVGSKRHTLKLAMEFIRSSDLGYVTVPDVADAASVSERTLQYAFKQQLGMTPKKFIKRYHLHCLHRDLRRNKSDNVTTLALKWGFWHMGQLGVDYKRLFGELPSRTLRKMPRKVQFLVPPKGDWIN